jgi:hypothetical protein
MKKILLAIIIACTFNNVNAQCSVATQTVTEDFNSNTLPTCWTQHNGFTFSGNEAWATENNNYPPMLILPKVVNASGILTFKARMNSSFGPPTVYIGVVSAPGSPASYVNITNFAITNSTMTSYTVNLSSYLGSFQYIALRLPSNNGRRFYIDDVNYTSACISTSVTAIAQNYTIQLNSNGKSVLNASQIDNGSTSECGTPTLSLSKSNFGCADIGAQTVTLTATDNSGNTSTATSNITILPAINDEDLSATQYTICSGKSATITTASSVNGIKYYLRDDATNAYITGAVMGTGNSLSFNTGTITANTTYNVYAETTPEYYALDFDGTNDVLNTNILSSATASLTLETWIYPRATAYKRIISNYTNNPTISGEFIFDTYASVNNGQGLRFYVEGAGNTVHQFNVANVLTLNTWQHVAATFENGSLKIYVNGVLKGSSTAPFTTLPACTNNIVIGEDPSIGFSEYFNGKMDDIRIWNKAKTASEILAEMNGCLNGNEPGLKAYFKLEEGFGTTTADAKGGTGTLVGMTNANWINEGLDCGDGIICSFEMTEKVTINIAQQPTITVNSGAICAGQSFTITPSGADTYSYTGGNNVVSPSTLTNYTVTGTSTLAGCSNTAVSTVSVNSLPNVTVNSGAICSGQTFTMNPNGANTYTYSSGSSVVSPSVQTSYTVTGTNTLTGCSKNAVSTVSVNSLPVITVNSGAICEGQSFTITPSGASTFTIQGGNSVVSPTTNTTYTVTGTSSNGCESNTFATSNVTVNALPIVTLDPLSSPLCVNSPSVALNGSPSGGSYIGTGVSGSTFNPSVGAGTYTINYNYTDANTCSASASQTVVVNLCTGIEDNTSKNNIISVYPNPAKNILTIDFSNSKNTISHVSIINTLGAQVLNAEITEEKTIINLNNLSNGLYFLQIGTQIIKFVKE